MSGDVVLDRADRDGFSVLLSVSWDMTRDTPYKDRMAEVKAIASELYTATDVLELGVGLADLVRAAQPNAELRMRIQDERVAVFELLTRFRLERAQRPVLLLFGTGWGLTDELCASADA